MKTIKQLSFDDFFFKIFSFFFFFNTSKKNKVKKKVITPEIILVAMATEFISGASILVIYAFFHVLMFKFSIQVQMYVQH